MTLFTCFKILRKAGFNKAPAHRKQAQLQLEVLESRLTPSSCSNQGNVLHVGPKEQYTTINAALAVVKPGQTIKVDSGTYVEQLNITTKNITIEGSGPKTIIEAPTTLTGADKALIDVNGAKGVTIEDFTIEGNPAAATDSLEIGVFVNNGGSATIADNHITKIGDSTLDGGQYGQAIFVGRQKDGTTGTATIYGNVIDGYQKGGIVVDNTGSSANISGNWITGAGSTSLLAQNGIQISNGATGQVTDNFVQKNEYTGSGTAAVGILLYNSGSPVKVSQNFVNNNDVGIFGDGATSLTIDQNFLEGNNQNGLILESVSGATVKNNTFFENGSGGATDGGIWLYATTNSKFTNNVSSYNNGDGMLVATNSTGNTFSQNQMKANSDFDVEDYSTGTGTAGTANTYSHNSIGTANPTGLAGSTHGGHHGFPFPGFPKGVKWS